MKYIALPILTVLLLTSTASGWGPHANEVFCKKTVAKVWGDTSLDCLVQTQDYCSQVEDVMGVDIGEKCRNAQSINPATAPEYVFEDFTNHMNYDDCPLKWIRSTNEFICEGEGNPAMEYARKWFEKSASETELNKKINAFCTGAYYFAASKYPLNQVTHLEGCLGGEHESEIDENIKSNDNWTVERQCVFSYQKQMAGRTKETSQQVTMQVSKEDFDNVLNELLIEAKKVNSASTTKTIQTTTLMQTTTSTTQQTITIPTTSTIEKTTTTIKATTSLKKTTTSLPKTTIKKTTMAPTTTIREKTTTTSQTTSTTLNIDNISKSLDEIESLFEKIENPEKPINKDNSQNQMQIIILALIAVLLISAITLINIVLKAGKSASEGSSKGKVIVPPSVRRRGRRKKTK